MIGDIADLFEDFKWTEMFVIQFSREGLSFYSFAVQQDKGARGKLQKVLVSLVIAAFHGSTSKGKRSRCLFCEIRHLFCKRISMRNTGGRRTKGKQGSLGIPAIVQEERRISR